jgi:hypothetical protein
MPVIYNTITEEMLSAMEAAVQDCETLEFASVFQQFRLYQDNRLKINKESRESKMAARKEGGGAKKGSGKMTGVVRLVAIEGEENVFKVEKVSIPAPAPVPASPEEEDAEPLSAVAKRVLKRVVMRRAKTPEPESEEEDISNNPEALAAAVAETAIAREVEAAKPVPAPKVKAPRKPRAPAIKNAAKKSKSPFPKYELVAPAEDSGEETEDAVEECD